MARPVMLQCDTEVAGVIGSHGARSKAGVDLRYRSRHGRSLLERVIVRYRSRHGRSLLERGADPRDHGRRRSL